MENAKLDDLSLKTWRTFITVQAGVLARIEAELEAAESIPLIEYDVLLTLWEAEDHRLRMHELASRVVLSRSGLTRLVDRLEREGYLTRERTSADRRGAYAVLTEAGIAAMRRAWPVYAAGIHQYFAAYLTDSEKATLLTALQRIDGGAVPAQAQEG